MAQRALLDSPHCAELNRLVAHIMAEQNRASFAQLHLDRAVAVDGDSLANAIAIGACQHAAGQLDQAADFYRSAITQHENIWLHAGLIGTLEHKGAYDEAQACLDQAQHKFPGARPLRRMQAILAMHRGDHMRAIATLSVPDVLPMELFDRGRAREAIGDYAGAWRDWMQGKQLLRDQFKHAFQVDQVRTLIGSMHEMVSAERRKLLRPARRPPDPMPIFIAGFPRTGTTLIETVLSSHSAIAAGDELAMLGEVVHRMPQLLHSPAPYPLCLMSLANGDNQAAMPELLQGLYLRKAWAKIRWRKRHKFFTDKMPLNEIHLPLMRLLFPSAPIVVMQRHPLDVVVSNMSHVITHGWYYAAALETCAEAIVLVDQLVDHYARAYSFMRLRYESFVAEPRAATDRLLHLVGLEPEPDCYTPEKNPRTSRTISYAQVRAPVSDRAVGRYKHFLPFLKPVVDQLGPLIERQGYELA